MKTVIMSLANS